MKGAVKLNKDAFRAWLAGRSAEAADMYQLVSRAAARAVAEGKTWVWKKFREAMLMDFRLVSKKFGQTLEGQPITQSGDIVGKWREHFEQLHLVADSFISLTVVSDLAKKLPSGKAQVLDEIHPEMLKALNTVVLS